MLHSISQLATPAFPGNGTSSGLDWIASLQILLIQDYDDQLRHLAQSMKSMKNVKQAYRRDIQNVQQALLGKTIKIDGKEYVLIAETQTRENLNRKTEHKPDLTTGGVQSYPRGSDRLVEEKSWEKDKDFNQAKGKGWVAEKEQLNQKIELLNQELDSYNEQSELTSLQLQTLTGQRKIAFETLSHLISKESEGLATILRNLRG